MTVEPQDFRRDMIHQRGTDGGAIALITGSHAIVRNNLLYGNSTGIGGGGGIHVWNESKPRISYNVICGNRTGTSGRPAKEGSRSSNGGGIAVSRDCLPEIIGNIILMNVTADNSDGGGIYLEYDANAHIRGNWIVGNHAQDDGGGMYAMKNSEPIVEYNIFAGNRTKTGGSSAIRLSKEGRMRAMNNLFISNPNNAVDAVNSWMILKNNTFAEGSDYAVVFENQKQHLAPSEISGNVFLGSPTPVLSKTGAGNPLIANNFVDAGAGDGAVGLTDNSYQGQLAGGSYDPAACVTRLKVAERALPDLDLSGRVIRIGEQWSVIKSAEPEALLVWGDLAEKAGPFFIAGTYHPAGGSVPEMGAYAAQPVKE